MNGYFIGTNHSSLWSQPPPVPTPSLSQSNEYTLQQRLQALIESAGEGWTYAIFWQIAHNFESPAVDNAVVLGWGDIVIRELNSLISGGGRVGVSETFGLRCSSAKIIQLLWLAIVLPPQKISNFSGFLNLVPKTLLENGRSLITETLMMCCSIFLQKGNTHTQDCSC
ncbi:hypothetical protein HA466_0137440 [Hirschfeldia incana]|nr:hypothetical protein HA466_0137440 [Hirschfeldia incana]